MNICIVDDHYIVREGIRMVLELEDDFCVVAEAENGQQALRAIAEHTIDLVLLDLNMPVMDGMEVLRVMQREAMAIPVIVLTTYKDDRLLVEAASLGVRSYLLKDAGREVIFDTIQRVLQGQTYFPPDIEAALRAAKQKQALAPTLTEKEQEVLRLLVTGMKNRDIAKALFVSERTVKAHLTVIYEKLHVKSRAQAIAVAIEQKYHLA